MPTYCLKKGTKRTEVVMSIKDFDTVKTETGIKHKGAIWQIDYARQLVVSMSDGGCWPRYSEAAGVHPDQVPSERERMRRAGVRTDFTEDGRPILRNALHEKRFCKANQLVNRKSYY